jgi:replicative superfamily II helicase
MSGIADQLCAEIVLGTVSDVKEAVNWLGYTYLFVRMMKNPALYGTVWDKSDPEMVGFRV